MTTLDSATTRWRRRATCALASSALLASGSVALAGVADAAPTTIYVNAAAQDGSRCGSMISQCATIQTGIDHASPGDTVLVGAGTYNESVDITKGVTVKSADGAATTIIDGAGLTVPNGLVNITQPAGDVTFSGFTVTNQPASSNGDAFALTVNDQSDADTITISQNVFTGDGTPLASTIGVDSGDTAAEQVITGNNFSGSWEGILLEGSRGPVDVSGNDFHDLVPADAGEGATYPAKGIFFLGDKNANATAQNVTDNKFYNYGGIGIDYRAGYDLGGCAGGATCEGSLAGTVTGNTFTLDAPAATNSALASQQPAAISLQSLNEGDQLNLTIGGNTGTVKAPTQPILQVAGDGTTAITPGTPNSIVPTPAPSIAVATPGTVVTGGPAYTFTTTATNNSGETIGNVRYGVTINGTKGITAAQVKLEYDADPTATVNFQPVPLTGTASAGGAITGSFGPAAGSSLGSSSTPVTTSLRLSFPSSTTPPDTLSTTVQLVQVSSGAGNPVINTLATSAAGSTVVVRHVTTTVVLTSPTKGQVIASVSTAPVRPGVKVAYYLLQGTAYVLYKTGVTTSKGGAAIAIPAKSGTTVSLVAKIYNDPTSDSAYSAPKSIRVS